MEIRIRTIRDGNVLRKQEKHCGVITFGIKNTNFYSI
jgi:hypothetical protein